jgi:hypothetical protein
MIRLVLIAVVILAYIAIIVLVIRNNTPKGGLRSAY